MGVRSAITWPRRRARCIRIGHKWYVGTSGGQQVQFCLRCGKRIVSPAPPPPPTSPGGAGTAGEPAGRRRGA